MAYICSIGKAIPEFNISQDEVKELALQVFESVNEEMERLLPIFDHAMIENRQFVVDKTWFQEEHSFEEKNYVYQKNAIEYSAKAVDDCLLNKTFLKQPIPYEAVDLIIYVSSTGIATPSIDAFLINERPFQENVERMPLWGLGCAGGAIGLSRAYDFVKAYPDKTALVISCELCGITFQHQDIRKSNIVGTALFGDGISAALLVGETSPYLEFVRQPVLKIMDKSSALKREGTHVMGWNVTNQGLQVIFSKSIPSLVGTFWKAHMEHFLRQIQCEKADITAYIAHPGGMKVLKAMEEALQDDREKLKFSYQVLKNHGNMSSATVLYVLQEWMKSGGKIGEKGLLSALGPGFSSELLLLDWKG